MGPFGDVPVARDLQGQEQEQHREGDEQRQEPGVSHRLGQHRRRGVFLDAHLPEGAQDLTGLGAPGAVGGAVAALMAQPDIRVLEHFGQTPLGLEHLLPGEGFFVRGEVAHHRTGITLITLFDRVPPGGHHPLHELEVRFYDFFTCHGSYLLKFLEGVGADLAHPGHKVVNESAAGGRNRSGQSGTEPPGQTPDPACPGFPTACSGGIRRARCPWRSGTDSRRRDLQPNKNHAVNAPGQGIGDPDHVEGPQAAQRDETDHRGSGAACAAPAASRAG